MNHAITIGGLLLGIGIVAGLLGSALGIVMIIGGGMSDTPDEDTSDHGCIALIVSAILLIGCIVGLVL